MLPAVVCSSLDKFRILKIHIPKCETNGIRSVDIRSISKKMLYFKLHHVFAVLESGNWLTFNANIENVNIFNSDIKHIFGVWEYILPSEAFGSSEMALEVFEPNKDDASFIQAKYISSYLFLQEYNHRCASEILNDLDDFLISRLVTNAFAFEDKQFALTQLAAAIRSPKARFIEGVKKFEYMPNRIDCVFEVLQVLMSDPTAMFLPYHPKSSFVGSVYIGNNSFKGQQNTEIPFASLTWDAEKVDLFASAKTIGIVEKPTGFTEKYNLPSTFETYAKRKFYFIRNGISENAKVYIKASPHTIKVLSVHGIIINDGGVWYVDFSNLPLISKKLSHSNITGPDLYEIVMKLIQEKKSLYGLLHIKNKLFKKTENSFDVFYRSANEEQKMILKEHYGIGSEGFQYAETDRRGPLNIAFYISDTGGENEISKLAYLLDSPLNQRKYTQDELKSALNFIESFSLKFFDNLGNKPSIDLEKKIEQTLLKIIELEFKVQHFRLVCITRDWWDDLVKAGVCGYKCVQGDLMFTEESLYA